MSDVKKVLKNLSRKKIFQLMDELIEEAMSGFLKGNQPKELAEIFNFPKVSYLDIFHSTHLIKMLQELKTVELNAEIFRNVYFPLNPSALEYGSYKCLQFLEERKSKREKLPYTISSDSIAKFFKPIERCETNEKDYKNNLCLRNLRDGNSRL